MYTVMYEDEDIVVVDKPAGISVHADTHHKEGTLLDEVRKAYPHAELAHRLDKDTSGLLVVAKHAVAYEYMKGLFKERRVEKVYQVLVVGEITKDDGIVELAIVRSKTDFRKRVATPLQGAMGKPAETHFHVCERFQGFTYIEAYPKTGRTHQIRSHMSAIGHPVACDALYGGKRYVCPGDLKRQFLHAYRLIFTAPNGSKVDVTSPLPKDLLGVLRGLVRVSE